MALTRERKEELVAQYQDMLADSRAIFFTEYRGLSNKDLTDARRKIRDAGGLYQVTKLTLFRIALAEQEFPVPEILTGRPIGVAFAYDEVPVVAKAITDFSEDSEEFNVIGGIMEGRYIDAAQVEAIAELPPLDVLRSQIIGTITAPSSNLIGVVQAGVGSVVNVLNAYLQDREGGEAAAD